MMTKQEKTLEVIKSGKYICDEDGNIFCLVTKNGAVKKIDIPRKVNGRPDRQGYRILRTKCSSGYIYIKFHQFVWLYFNGAYDTKLVINHKNGIKTDNSLKNLELCTNAENMRHAGNFGLMKSLSGSKNPNSKLKELDVKIIKKRLLNGEKDILIAKDYSVTRQTISSIKKNETWTHVC